MSKIKMIKMTGLFDVRGVVNYNVSVEARFAQNTGFIGSYKKAKKNVKGVDFTSSNCLRQAMFADLVPRQPGSEEMKKDYPRFIGSLAGLLRGGMDAESSSVSKSPLKLMDAYSSDNQVFFEQQTSSKIKEADLKNKKGEDAKDTSVWHKDNAGPRKQELMLIIDINDLQFKEVSDDSGSVVKQKESGTFLSSVKTTFESLGVGSEVSVKTYRRANAGMLDKRTGVLFNDAQQSALVLQAINLASNIEIYRKDACLCVDKGSLSVTVIYDDMSTATLSLKEAQELIKNAEFQKFWENAE